VKLWNIAGDKMIATRTGSSPIVPVPIFQNGLYYVDVQAEGYLNATDEIVVDCDPLFCDECKPAITVYLTPDLQYGNLQVRLSWTEHPKDLDIHAFIQNPAKQETCHLYYAKKNCTVAVLDIDNDDGGLNGAETISVLDVDSQIGSIYMIYIHKFRGTPSQFKNSKAQITLEDGFRTTTTFLEEDEFANEDFYVAGCMRILGHKGNGHTLYQWAPIKRFFNENPTEYHKDLCMNMY